jgi:hypothetical protein
MVQLSPKEAWDDLQQALDFAQRRFEQWQKEGALFQRQLHTVQERIATRRKKWQIAEQQGLPVPGDSGLPPGRAGESPPARSYRYWTYLLNEVRFLSDSGVMGLAQAHGLIKDIGERQAALERRLEPEDFPEVIPSPADEGPSPQPEPREAAPRRPRQPRQPRRNLLEVLLDPRNIQWLLAFGGGLMVIGLIIILWINEFFQPPTIAVAMGVINAALLGTGWWVLRSTRYQTAGRALTLLACLVMPLNLWYYHAHGLITLEGHLWVAALVISALYAASAWVLKDEVFVYVFLAGVTMTGLLILAGEAHRFWEIASPATMLVVLGVIAIHVERAFPPGEGPFSRKRFGLAFFWSGHALLAAGLLLVLGAEVAGKWLYEPLFKSLYIELEAQPSPIVNELRLLALALVAAGTYVYIYSDLIVRKVGVYVHCAAFTLMWAVVLLVEQLNIELEIDAWILVLAITGLLLNVLHALFLRHSPFTRSLPYLGALMPLLAVLLGVVVWFRAVSPDLRSTWPVAGLTWNYAGAMVLTAISCRIGAYLYRHTLPSLTLVYFFAAGAATLMGAVSFLAVIGLNRWEQHGPILMLVPILYLVAARLYRGHSAEKPVYWISQAATVVMLLSSVAVGLQGFLNSEPGPLNLPLALFYAEVALFYGLSAGLFKQRAAIHLAAAFACGTVWQLLTFVDAAGEWYPVTFAVLGLILLIVYRFGVLERTGTPRLAESAFQSANTLLSLAFVAAALLALSRLATREIDWIFVVVCLVLLAISLLALALVRHAAWQRWYVVTSISQALLAFLGVQVLSHLSPWQKLEIFSVVVGLALLAASHIGWYREQERENDLVSIGLFLGSLLVGIPLAVATCIDRSRNDFLVLNELGFLVAGILLLTTGFLFQLKSTTLVGAVLTVLYFVTLLIYVPWSRLNTLAIFITVGGGILFGTGLLLSIYRERLLTLPDRIKRKEGLFRILSWR